MATAFVPPKPMFTGARVKRREDPRLLTGQASYVDDIHLPGMLEAAVLRSPHAHARIRGIDVSRARSAPGVVMVVTGAEVRDRVKPLPVLWFAPGQTASTYAVLNAEKVHYVGEPVAVVVAEDRYQAEDALDLIEVDYEPLPPVIDAERALAPDAPIIHEDWGSNLIARVPFSSGDVEAAFRDAAAVVKERFRIQRHTGFPMETRGMVARYEPFDGQLTLWTSTQSPHVVQTKVAESLGHPENKVRVIAPEVGGAFGLKDHAYPEEVLISLLSIETRRPVKWIEDRREHFVATVHSREQVHDVEMAVSEDGTIIGIRGRFFGDAGAELPSVGPGPMLTTLNMLIGPYKISTYQNELNVVATNKMGYGPYRGFGAPQGVFVMERLIDRAARALNLDPATVRLKNLIPPEEMPYTTPTFSFYDSGDYPAALRRALELVGYDEIRARQGQGPSEGRYLGVGLGCYVEGTGFGPSPIMGMVGMRFGGYESAVVRMDPTGKVTVFTGTSPHGQGLETTLAQLAADALGIDVADIMVVHGDSEVCPYSDLGTVGSRSAVVGGASVLIASGKLREKIAAIAASMLEASPDDIEIAGGQAAVRGAPARAVSVADVAHRAYRGQQLPAGTTPTLEERAVYDPVGLTFPYATHAAVVEVDAATGQVRLLKYVVVHDCGTIINPTIVEGQAHGGVTQGIGGALLEELIYDENGQLLTGTFLDYLLPTAADVPNIEVDHLQTPAPNVPGGMKGAGEAGALAPPAAITNAIEDALSPLGVVVRETPVTPSRLFQWIEAARG